MMDFLPEWQIQESLATDPKPLEIPGRFEGIRVKREQRYLPSIGRYIDLLCTTRKPRGWLIVEIKAEAVWSSGLHESLDHARRLHSHGVLQDFRFRSRVGSPFGQLRNSVLGLVS
jgi:hypothetical protein